MKISLWTFLTFTIGFSSTIVCEEKIEQLKLINSSYEELKSGYSCVYDPQKKSVQCTPLPNTVDKKPVTFEQVEVVDCCSKHHGKIIGTCVNCKYDPKVKSTKDEEPPFFLVISTK